MISGFWRYFWRLFAGLAVVITVSSCLFYREEVEIERQRILERNQHHVEIQQGMLTAAMHSGRAILDYVADLVALHRPFSGPDGLRLLHMEVVALLRRVSTGSAVHLMDGTGRVRLLGGTGSGERQDMPASVRRGVMHLKPGRAYMSSVRLERTAGRRPVPVMWLARAVPGHGRKPGAVVLRLAMDRLLGRFQQVMDQGGEAYLVDRAGYFLSSPHPDWNWGFALAARRDKRFDTLYPLAWRRIRAARGGTFEAGGDLYMYRAMEALPPAPEGGSAGQQRWFIIARFPAATLYRMMARERALFYVGGGMLLLAAALVSGLLARLHVQRARAGEQLEASRRKLAHILATTPAVHYVLRVQGMRFFPVFISSNLVKLFGWHAHDVPATPRWWLARLHPDERRQVFGRLRIALAGEQSTFVQQYRFRCADGRYLWVHDCLTIERDRDGRAVEVVGSWLDVTDRVRAEERLKASLREKEVLLRELHHRVKNNMQIISSLLRLQAAQADNRELQAMCRESQERIRTMSLVHEQLYASERLDTIPAQTYFENIVASQMKSRGVSDHRIRVHVRADDIVMGMDEAVPCGLIINELVSNALKHAFLDGRGEIHVCLSAPDDAHRLIRVYDNGCGLPLGMDIRAAKTLGLQLVDALAAQLDGELSIGNTYGADIRILFPASRGGGA